MLVFEAVERQDTLALTEPFVCLLKHDDIRIDFADHIDDPMGIPPPVKPDGLPDIVACNPDHHQGCDMQSGRTKSHMNIAPSPPALHAWTLCQRRRGGPNETLARPA